MSGDKPPKLMSSYRWEEKLYFNKVYVPSSANPSGHSLAEIACSNLTGGHEYLSVVIVECCQVEISAWGW